MPPGRASSARAGRGLREVVAGFRYAALHKVLLVSFLVDIIAMALRHAAGLVPGDGRADVRRPARRRHRAGPAVRRDPDRMRSSAGCSPAGSPGPPPRRGGAGGDLRLGARASRCSGCTSTLWLAVLLLAVGRGGRPGQRGVPVVDAADRGHRRDARPDAGRVHRRRRRRPAGGRPLARRGGRRRRARAAATAGGIAVIVLTMLVVARFPEFWRYRGDGR